MVFATEAAVVVKGRDGRTVLLQSRGLDVQQATRAAAEAMAALQVASQSPEPFDILSSTQAPPLLSARLDGLYNNLSVTYRVAGALILMVVSPAAANVFACLHLLGQVARVVMAPADGKAVEMTPERVQRRFGEIYLAIDALLGSGGVLEANAALGRALTTLEHLFDKEKEKDKEGGGKGGKAAAPEPPKTPPQRAAGGPARTRRTLQGAIDQLALLSFSAGAVMQAIPPLPGFQLPDGGAGPAGAAGAPRGLGAAAGDPFAGLQGPGVASAQSTADPFGDDDIFGLGGKAKKKDDAAKKAGASDDPFAASDGAPPAWEAFDAKQKEEEEAAKKKKADEMGFEDDAFGGAAAAAAAPPPPLVPSEPVLRLVEVWRGECAGGRLVRAGLSGRVEWVSEGAKAKVHTVQFMVQVPEHPNDHLAAALTTARRHPSCCRPGPAGGVLLADGIQAKPHPGAPLLCYHLPPVACPLPLQVRLGSSWQALPDGRRLVTLGLHYAVEPRLAGQAAVLDLDLTVPALLGQPLRVEPPGATFDARARLLRWQQQGPVRVADNTGAAAEPCVAVFVVEGGVADEAALGAALGRLTASMSMRGADGSGSISGAALAQGVVELELTRALCGWRVQMSATV